MKINYSKWVSWLLILIPAITFAFYLFDKAANIPYGDDSALFLTVNEINEPISRVLTTLFEQHNEHRILFSRLAMLFVYEVTDNINFRYVILLGFFNIALLAYTFNLIFKTFETKLYFFLPVVILLFSPIIHTNHLWAITSFEYILAITFSLLTLYFLQPELSRKWHFSLLFAIAAPLSNLDGICVLPVALVWLILQKRKKESLLFGGFMLVYLIAFFYNFSLTKSISHPPILELAGILVTGTLSFIGAIVKVLSDSHASYLSIILGGLIALISLGLIIRKAVIQKEDKTNIFPLNINEIALLNLFACGLMIAFGRASSSIPSLIADRFQIYAVTIAILFYLVVLNHINQHKIKRIVLYFSIFSAVFLNLLSYLKYEHKVDYHNDKLYVDAYNYTHHAVFLHQFHNVTDPPQINFRNYRFPVYFPGNEITEWNEQVKNSTTTHENYFNMETMQTAPDLEDCIYPILNINIDNIPDSLKNKRLYLLLSPHTPDKAPYLAAIKVKDAGWLKAHLKSGNGSRNSASLAFTNKLRQDNYDIALCWKDSGKLASYTLAKSVKITNPINME